MISDITTRSLDANNAYGLTQQATQSTTGNTDTDGGSQSSDPVSGFTAALDNAVRGAINTGKTAEAQTAAGLSGKGNLTDITTSVEEAKLTLQTVTTVRDRVVQAYQDVMKMSI
ncbi:flagellar hook-basal body complex protein FliE [Komagataeibacter sp. FNDCR2]|uniref:flagellar hook-basal body complex protein FliE n=1 Tax=Komagataeibacter sp. FNDCR2 TaxID=2878682 RepID=UPI001E2FBBEE|nr:flagellar hook-basal body complex protein FliE [Komagataeibacter sp. FNDCR2]MCE2576790.1 flagellar hook-basal body complex protein FliE [Komagataeibacter sp. FNDCR2]